MVDVPGTPVTFGGGFARATRENREVAASEERNRILMEQLEQQADELRAKQVQDAIETSKDTLSKLGELGRTNPEAFERPGVQQLFEQAIATGQEAVRRAGRDPSEITAAAELARAGVGIPADLPEEMNRIGTMVARMQGEGFSRDQIAATLQSMATVNPALREPIEALIGALPTAEQAGTVAGRRAEGEAQIAEQALLEAGVDERTAALGARVGGLNVELPTERQPGTLTTDQEEDLRQEIIDSETALDILDQIEPLINDKTVGIWAELSRGPGGIIQQIPGIRSVANAIGERFGLDEASVIEAASAGAAFERAVFQLRDIIGKRGAKASNQELDLLRRATAVLQGTSTPEAARQVIREMRAIEFEQQRQQRTLLETGQLPAQKQRSGLEGEAEGAITVIDNKDGSFTIRDETGAEEIIRIE